MNSFALYTGDDGFKILVWPGSAIYSIEEYIFSRFYMYNSVYQHKTTRGFEKLVLSAWNRQKWIRGHGNDAHLVREIAEFLDAQRPTVRQYRAMEDATLVYQMQVWTRHPDAVLNDLARRFLGRGRLSPVDDPVSQDAFSDARADWEQRLRELVAEQKFDPNFYVLRDDLKLTIYNPYTPEKEEREQDPYNAIFVQDDPGKKPRKSRPYSTAWLRSPGHVKNDTATTFHGNVATPRWRWLVRSMVIPGKPPQSKTCWRWHSWMVGVAGTQ